MTFIQGLIETNDWFCESFAYNLGFIPEDKLSWKPAPTARSAYEIVHHIALGMANMQAIFLGGTYGDVEFPEPVSLLEAQTLIRGVARDYSEFLKGVQPSDLEGEFELPFGTLPKTICIGMEVQDLIHHHGQITYIQALLGDTEDHIFDAGN
ncbi:DinB family protein [bacterium]|nr:MAG: DinB family protein [bacterium]